MTVEQMCRDLLSLAIAEGLVYEANCEWEDPDPQARSSGELVAMANLLRQFIEEEEKL